jgi:hypothetical protein
MTVYVLFNDTGDNLDLIDIFESMETLKNSGKDNPKNWASPMKFVVEPWELHK